MRALIPYLLTLLMLPSYSFSQRDETLLRNPGLKWTGIWAGSVTRIQHFNKADNYVHGGFFAMEFNKDYMVGWDGYTVNVVQESLGDTRANTNALYLGYAKSGFRIIHPTASLSIGAARVRNEEYPMVKVLALNGTLGAEFNLFRWLRIGADLGYRYLDTASNTWMQGTELSGPYAGLRLKFGWSWGR